MCQAVADTRLREDVGWVSGVVTQLATKALYERAKETETMVSRAVLTPDSFQQLIVSQYTSGIGGKLEQQLVLGRRELCRAAFH